MTEREWVDSECPREMILCLGGANSPVEVSGRKWRLAACAFAHLCAKNDKEHKFVESWWRDIDDARPEFWNRPSGLRASLNWCESVILAGKEPAGASVLRCIFGNPWRPVVLPVNKRLVVADGIASDIEYCGPATAVVEECPWLTWNDRAIPRLAEAIYDERAFDRMGILADALLEAGCVDEMPCWCCEHGSSTWMIDGRTVCCNGTGRIPHPLIEHCRSEGPHGRGCFVLDTILGKS